MGETNQNLGLTSAEAVKRFKQYGPNQMAEGKKISGLVDFLVRFKNPLVLILVFAAGISALTGDPVSATIIIAIILVSVLLDFINTFRSSRAAEELKEKVQVLARVIRDGKTVDLPLRQIVPGDAVELEAGDLVPADGKILQAKDFFLNESALTGESFPTEKEPGTPLFLGTSVISGTATMEVELTGRQTKFSHIAQSLEGSEQPTEFDRSIKDFSYLIMKITFVLVICIFLINALLKANILESFLFSAALAVGLTPELLPMIIALNLSKGSLNMSKHGVIVKKLSSIQNFGSMDVLCTDKTGTLTEDNIVLVKYLDAKGEADEKIFEYAYLTSTFRSGFHNPLDAAIKKFKKIETKHYQKLDEIPFDFDRRRDSVVVESAAGKELVAKGAPEGLLTTCGHYKNEETKLTPHVLKELEDEYRKLSQDGFRVLGIAYKPISESKRVYDKADESAMIFLGFVAFLDPPKKTVTETLKLLEHYGISIKIITGDNDLVTKKIAQEIELPVLGVLLGEEIEKLSDHEMVKAVEATTIFARVNPEQKKRIIIALQKNGHTVGYMGDGINDAPSLKAADVGISVNNAVNVAKDSADLILMHKSLRDLANGVIQGRQTFANTMKYLMMALSSNFGNMFSMAGASLFFKFLPMLPTQILFNNLLYDSSQFTIPLDRVDHEQVQKPRKMNLKFIKEFMLVFGPVSSVFDFATFYLLFVVFKFSGSKFQTGWFLESLATQALVIFIIRTKKIPFLQSNPSKYLAFSVLAAIAAGWWVALSRFGAVFKFAVLPVTAVGGIILITAVYLVLVELIKRRFYRRFSD